MISLTILETFPSRKVDCSHDCGSPWQGYVRVLIHNHISLHGWALSNGCKVSHFWSSSDHMNTWERPNDSYRVAFFLTLFFFRQNGIGFTSFVARLGVSIAPLIMLLEDVWSLLPSAIYCAVAVGCGLVNILLPETLHSRLPETIEDIEKPKKRIGVPGQNCIWMFRSIL